MTKILLIGKSARLHCIAETLNRSPQPKKLYTLFPGNNPVMRDLSDILEIGHPEDIRHAMEFAQRVQPDFAIIGPEEPLAQGIVDALLTLDIPCIGPSYKLARIESSKAFCRKLLEKYRIFLLECNARFGDPEIMNALPLLDTDFIAVCDALLRGTLHLLPITFRREAVVCKYVVPKGYPLNPLKNMPITFRDMPAPDEHRKLYYGGVDARPDGLYLTGSRTLACVGIDKTLAGAERIAEDVAQRVSGIVYHRRDIGTENLVNKRITHLRTLLLNA